MNYSLKKLFAFIKNNSLSDVQFISKINFKTDNLEKHPISLLKVYIPDRGTC